MAGITFIVMLIMLVNLHTKMHTIVLSLNVLVKKINGLEEKVKWDNNYIKSKLK